MNTKESTGFEPVHEVNPRSADFESAALPLCQLSEKVIKDISSVPLLVGKFK